MGSYNNILCATDFSVHSRAAAERAADIARQHGARLTLLHVVEYFPEDRSNTDIAPEDVDPAAYSEQKARAALVELSRPLDYDNLEQEVRFTSHSAKHEIVHFAREKGVDLVVLATHGHHGIAAMLGSTACGVTHYAPCDVLTVRAGARE